MVKPAVFAKAPVVKEFLVNFPVVNVFWGKPNLQNRKQALPKIPKVCDFP